MATVPRYMEQLLDQLGWNTGQRIPLADKNNKELETLLIRRQEEIQRLKDAFAQQSEKCSDLAKYKSNVVSEYQENTKLLFAQKQQYEQEMKMKQLAHLESERYTRDINDRSKELGEVDARLDKLHGDIARLLKKTDELKQLVTGSNQALQEWRECLDRSACDISAIEQFTKQDISKAKELEYKRIRVKVEHDRVKELVLQACSDLHAEERAGETMSNQIKATMEERRKTTEMWLEAVENLRQRDKDIKHTKEEYEMLEAEVARLSETCRERQRFCELEQENNAEQERRCAGLNKELALVRRSGTLLAEENATLDSEVKSLQRVLTNMRHALERLYQENKSIMDEQYRKDMALKNLVEKIEHLKAKKVESNDKERSSDKRSKELEDMLNEEEKHGKHVTTSQQRAMHCAYIDEQKLLELKNEEKRVKLALEGCKTTLNQLESQVKMAERNAGVLKEALYTVSYQVETTGAQVALMEGRLVDRDNNVELMEKEKALKDILAGHTARVALLERNSIKLNDDMRRINRELIAKSDTYDSLKSRLKSSMLNVDGSEKEVRALRDEWRGVRVDEALTKLRVAHAERAVAALDDAAYTLDAQRLELDAAMNERLVEIGVRRDMFSVQKRSLYEACGKLRCDIRERENRIDQLKKRYDIFISSLGKDDSGQTISVTFFKIKFAAERAELRAHGAQLDAQIKRSEQDVRALEASLRVLQAAHHHFMSSIASLPQDAPEMEKLQDTQKQYYALKDALAKLQPRLAEQLAYNNGLQDQLTAILDKQKQLKHKEHELEVDLEEAEDRLSKQKTKLMNARELCEKQGRRAHRLLGEGHPWDMFYMQVWCRDYAEAAYGCLRALVEVCDANAEMARRTAELTAQGELLDKLPKQHKRCLAYLKRLMSGCIGSDTYLDVMSSVSMVSSSTAASKHSRGDTQTGPERRLSALRKSIAMSISEPQLLQDKTLKEVKSSSSLQVVNLALPNIQTRMLKSRFKLKF